MSDRKPGELVDLATARRTRKRAALKASVAEHAQELGLDLAQPEAKGVCVVAAGVRVAVNETLTTEQCEDLVCAVLNAARRFDGVEAPNLGLGYDPYHSIELDELRELIAEEFGGVAEKGFYFDRVKEVAAELRALRAKVGTVEHA